MFLFSECLWTSKAELVLQLQGSRMPRGPRPVPPLELIGLAAPALLQRRRPAGGRGGQEFPAAVEAEAQATPAVPVRGPAAVGSCGAHMCFP